MTMPTVSVIVPHLYRERERNLLTIVDALLSGTTRPLEIIVWCNESLTKELGGVLWDTVRLVESSWNVGCQARFLAALVARGDYVLFQDNDVCVRSRTVENMLSQASPGKAVSLDGYHVPPLGYTERRRFFGWNQTSPVRVNLTLGRMEMVERKTLLRVLRDFPFDASTVMDDMAFSAACKKNDVPIFVVPALDRDFVFVNLPDGGVGLSKGMPPSYVERRDRTFRELGL
jgi:hypothetical protein